LLGDFSAIVQIGLRLLVATRTANIVAVPRTFPAIVMSALTLADVALPALKTCADVVELFDFVQDRFKNHRYTALAYGSLRWEDFRFTGLGQKTERGEECNHPHW